ncbi:hypothetical protein RJ640_016241 [Escallonia rubra]|uniref:Uncharacterized protein n=1 Tax=Escallonia rubra TaxID=112253 RepID=A0AA88RWN9_9ASTE|nr:hypothetical protein RJ640_016241 [Escallonia rubra]
MERNDSFSVQQVMHMIFFNSRRRSPSAPTSYADLLRPSLLYCGAILLPINIHRPSAVAPSLLYSRAVPTPLCSSAIPLHCRPAAAPSHRCPGPMPTSTAHSHLGSNQTPSFLNLYPESKPLIVAPKSILLISEEEFKKWLADIPFHNLNKLELSGKENIVAQWVATELRRREPHDLAFAMVIVERLGDFKQCERPRSPRHERAKDGGDDRSKSGSPKATDDERSGDEGRRRHHKGEKKHGESRKRGDSCDHKAHGGLRRECFYCACPHYGKDCPHKGKMIAFLEKHKSSKGDSSRSDGEARIGALQMSDFVTESIICSNHEFDWTQK